MVPRKDFGKCPISTWNVYQLPKCEHSLNWPLDERKASGIKNCAPLDADFAYELLRATIKNLISLHTNNEGQHCNTERVRRLQSV